MYLFFNHLSISAEMANALCWALIHSLWQGALLAVLAGGTLLATRKSRAALRYNLLAALFALFLLGVGYTYLYVAQAQAKAAVTVSAIADAALTNNKLGQQPIAVAINMPAEGWFNAAIEWCNGYSWWVVMVWIIIMGLKCLRMGLDLWYIQRLCTRQINVPAPYWSDRIQQLAHTLRISRPIRFLESARVKVPATVGFLKPVVLLPMGMLAQLPPEHIEAILLHELAHIRRNDYFINLLQSVAEILFFFNPALLWVSALLRTERENCCDDIAISAVENKTQYIRALVAFQEYHLAGTSYALAFADSKTPLLDRIKRIIQQHNTKKLSIMEKISLFISILLIGTIALLPLTKTKAQQTTTEQTFSRVNISGEGVATDPQIMFLRETDGKTYIITRVDQKVTEMYVNGQKITEDHFADYNGLLKKIDEQIAVDIAQAKLDAEQAQRDQEQAQRDEEQAQRDEEQAQRDAEQAQLDAIQAGKDSEQAVRDAEQALRDAKQAELDAAQERRDADQSNTDREQARRDADQAIRDAEQARRDAEQAVREAYNDRDQAKRDAEQAQRDAAQAKQDAEQATRDTDQAKRDSEIAQRDMEQAKRDSEDDRMMQKNMTAMAGEMVTDQIVGNKKSIDSFALTDTEFIVNGKKQHEVVHQKYKDKYLKKPGYGIYYGNSQQNGTGYFYAKKKGGL